MIASRRGLWLPGGMVAATAFAIVFLIAPSPSYARKRPRKPERVVALPTPSSTPAPAPEVKVWDFDHDKADQIATGWTAIEGDWAVIPDNSAPSQPNTFGLPSGRFFKSLVKLLEYYPLAVMSDTAEYGDFTLEASFKAAGGRLDCSGGLVFRYVDPRNYYVLQAGCPSDYFALILISGGQQRTLKQAVVPIDRNVWYQLRVVAKEDHFSCYSGNKMVLDVVDKKIHQGRIGLWARADAQARFDHIKLTLPPREGEAAPSPAPPAAAPTAATGAAAPESSLPPPVPK